MSIPQKISAIRNNLPIGVELCAVSKFHSAEAILEAYETGQRVFGENRVQELCQKAAVLPNDIKWHFIGHLQTNKVKQVVPVASLIHSVDSMRILKEINEVGKKIGKVSNILIELHIAQEETKSGLTPMECLELLDEGSWREMNNICICGLMTMATNTDDEQIIESDFAKAEEMFHTIKERYFAEEPSFAIRSWGMSNDYHIALRHSANIIRIGTAIFGKRVQC